MCEAEQWDDALVELRRQGFARSVREQETAWRAKIYVGMGRYAEVLKLADEARRRSCDIRPYLAIAHARLGHREQALRIGSEALRGKAPDAQISFGHVCRACDRYEEALRWFEAAARNRKYRASAQCAIGDTLAALGDYREAAAAYEQAIRLTPFARPEDLRALSDCYAKTHWESAARELAQLAEWADR
ncbi:MAG TPA: tetratricopeptide repeat protein [Chthonomonadaceae bacterium]|nr:tetratricopeptide repeat protein [Chthonomonadaceae bacterium]